MEQDAVVLGNILPKTPNHPRLPTAQDKEFLRELFMRLYIEKHLNEVIQIIEDNDGFNLTKKEYFLFSSQNLT